jgi:hypothetical protein
MYSFSARPRYTATSFPFENKEHRIMTMNKTATKDGMQRKGNTERPGAEGYREAAPSRGIIIPEMGITEYMKGRKK